MPNMMNQISIVYVLPAKQGKINDSVIRMSLLLVLQGRCIEENRD